MMKIEELKALPKIELHCHLDGSLSKEYLEERLGREVSPSEMSVSGDCKSLAEYLEKFDLPCSCLMDAEGLEKAGIDVLRTMSREHVIYAEIRFAPLLSTSDSLKPEEVVEALLGGLAAGKEKYKVSSRVILCLMRHHSYEQNLSVIKLAEKYLGKGVCAIDLAGAEAQYPMAEFMELFTIAREKGIPFTVHAGECGSVKNIMDAAEAGSKRIGHGIAMRSCPEVQALIKEKQIGVEMCPISNLQTKAVPEASEYPMQEFLDAGLSVSINTDNRSVSATSMTKELAFIQKTYGVTDEQIKMLMKNAAKTAFLSEEEKTKLLARL